MIAPASNYRDKILELSRAMLYTDDYFYYCGRICHSPIDTDEVAASSDVFQWAVLSAGLKVIGYISYCVDWYASSVNDIGILSFDKGSLDFGIAVKQVLDLIHKEYDVQRIEFSCILDNPARPHYDRYCERHEGSRYVLHSATRDEYGKYHDMVIYEILF